ncbi:MAG TPA: 4Fe-4S dicluster domain-containing protein [Deferrisomatales bacterium]|nr:4Fe-4S dicluster domain-containing protein [Deferrisomatales bacterium]
MSEKTTTRVKVIASGDRTILPEGTKMIPVYIMGKKYMLPETLTIQKAIEYAGYQFIRACGCRGGICGACPTVWRVKGNYQLQFGLACQTVIEADMVLAQLPFFPANRATYKLGELTAAGEAIASLYPEVMKCVGCNTCTRACPMEIDVRGYINSAMRGDVARAAKTSFDCIQCGLCSARCPAQIAHYHVAQLCRRIFGRYVLPPAAHLESRVEEITSGRYDGFLEDLKGKSEDELRKLYVAREPEPQDSTGWEPQDKTYL